VKLKWFHVREFQSIRDSGRVNVDDITCLVGKNEAGKSALLKALYRLNPVVAAEGKFNVTTDYPRMDVEDYRHAVESGKRSEATPIVACYELDEETAKIEKVFGPGCIPTPELTLTKSYSNARSFTLTVDNNKALTYLFDQADLVDAARTAAKAAIPSVDSIIAALAAQEQTEEVTRLAGILAKIKARNLNGYIYDVFIAPGEPEYLYFDEYYQMTGHENIEQLVQREKDDTLKPSDHPLLGLIRLARLDLNDLVNADSTIELTSKLEGASNYLSKQVLKYWSQNKHLRMKFDVRPGRPGDPEGMQSGTNIWGGVFDTRHSVTTELGSRSRGFVWFFSFLAWYSDVKKEDSNVVLLLDEPGMTLHAKAQYDLLRYFETELLGSHQLLYSTHSPFMIDAEHFERVRIVQDKSLEKDVEDDSVPGGTTVISDIFQASEDSLFPLQGALGYELNQTLFVGPFTLIVEGAADLLFIQTVSALLQQDGRIGLDTRWTITPVGGSTKVPTFVALLGAQRGMTIATLIDSQAADKTKIEALYKDKLLKKANVMTFADFTQTAEADIEDMFGDAFYLDLVNAEFASQLGAPLALADFKSKNPRILQRIEIHLETVPLTSGSFGHYRPARYFTENSTKLWKKMPKEAKDRFEAAFKTANALIK